MQSSSSLIKLSGSALETFKKKMLKNLIKISLLERQCSVDIRVQSMLTAIELKRRIAILLEKVVKSPENAEIYLTPEEICSIEIPPEFSKELPDVEDSSSLKEGAALLKEINNSNIRLYLSILSFASGCRKMLFKETAAGSIYNKKGSYKEAAGYLHVNTQA